MAQHPHFILIFEGSIMNFITKATSNYRGTQPLLGKILIGFSGFSAVLAAWNYLQSKSAESDLEFRKKQLSKPIYKLSPE
jgi:uncharacterized membrane protein YidH (DUF202 family)